MNRIDILFERKKEKVLSVYMTAGYPELKSTVTLIKALEHSGVDLIEVGMPFSDPLADGPVIQQSSQKALENGMNLRLLFKQLNGIRDEVELPLLLMGYLNPVLQFGFEAFLEECIRVGIDGLIIPDLPMDLYNKEFRDKVESAGLKFIMLITPQTTGERLKKIVDTSTGFLYMVADSATTGARTSIHDTQLDYFKRIDSMNLSIPRLIGFGISNAETFELASGYANGAIIGSAFINAIFDAKTKDLPSIVEEFTEKILSRERS